MPTLVDDNGQPIDIDAIEPEAEAEEQVAPEEEAEADEQEEPAAEADEADDESDDAEADDEGVIFTLDGEPVEDEDDDLPDDVEPSAVIREMRKKLKEAARERRELQRQLEQSSQPAEAEDVGPRPTLEAFEYDEDKYAEALASYLDRKKEADQRQAAQAARAEQINQRFEQKKAAYAASKAKVGAPDFEEAENAFTAMFNPTAQGVALAAAKEPEKVIYALGKSPALAKTLAELQDDPIALAGEIGRLESRIGTKPRKPRTKPEPRVRGSASTAKPAAQRDLDRAINDDDMTAALRIYREHSG